MAGGESSADRLPGGRLHLRLRTPLSVNGAGQIPCSERQVDQEQARAFVLMPW
jgi:hypothetical protein